MQSSRSTTQLPRMCARDRADRRALLDRARAARLASHRGPVLRAAQVQYIREARASKSAPLLEMLRTWANEQHTLPQGKLGEALTYLKKPMGRPQAIS